MADRFRYSGVNWEGRPWAASAPIIGLGRALSKEWPTRHTTDGTVASEGHDTANPKSDHRPYPYTGKGLVRAIDFGVSSRAEGDLLAECIDLDPRVSYVLWQVKDHFDHVHVSMKWSADKNTEVWHLLNQHEIEQLKLMVAGLDQENSNGGFTVQAVQDIRAKNQAESQHGGYANRDELGSAAGLKIGDKVKLAAP